jgi:tetratricopeptide (TPR) repeat protein
VSQTRRRPAAKPTQKRRAPRTNRSQRVYAILGVVIVFSLIAAIAGPPLVDFLTRPSNDSPISVNDDTDNGEDPVVADYLSRIDADPNDASAMAGLGNYYGNTGRIDEAIPWYEKALVIAPDDWDTRLGFARALSIGGKRQDAELQFKKVIAARPNDPQAHFSLGQLYSGWVPPRTQDAIAEYQTTVMVGQGTFVAERAAEELAQLGVASPVAASPVASPVP